LSQVEVKKDKQEARAIKQQALSSKRELRARKEALKTRTDYASDAQKQINKYVRLRDRTKKCISCDKPDRGQLHASHWKSVGSNSALRFCLWNIHASCVSCNKWRSGAIGDYTPRLIDKIGQEKVDWLETQNHTVKYDIDYLKRLKKVFAKRCRTLERRV